MKPKNFDEIIRIWQNAEQESLSQFVRNRSDSCLTFSQLNQSVQGKFSPEQHQHVQNCGYCQKMIRLFQKYVPDASLTAKRGKRWTRLRTIVKSNWQGLTEEFRSLVKPIPVPARIAIAGIVATIILLLLFLPSEQKYSHLARVEPLYYLPIESRGEASLSKTERLFQQGMAFYQQGEYKSAINTLLLVIKQQPDDASANFYLGLCYLLIKKPDRAIFYLQKVIELNGDFLFEKCYWYLGNAYLLKNDGKRALAMFEKVVALEGDFEWEARGMIEKISTIK